MTETEISGRGTLGSSRDKQEAAPAENGCIVDSYWVDIPTGLKQPVKLGRDEAKPKPARVYEP